jgi:multidrug efflux system outer membrane protein
MMPRTRIAGWLLLATLLPGCAMLGPDYQRPSFSLPAIFGTDSASDTDQAVLTAESPWWELYQDPVLNDLVSKALENNSDIKIAVARVEEADAFMREVGSALFPQIDLDAGGSRSRISQLGPNPLFGDVKPIRESYNIAWGPHSNWISGVS